MTDTTSGSVTSAALNASKLVATDTSLESLLEQLRNKHGTQSNNDSWVEFSKQIRMASLDKKQYRDKAVITESLEKLQNTLTASTLTQVLEKIESACQKLGLRVSTQGSQVYITADMFYVEIQLEVVQAIKSVRDVRVSHTSVQQQTISSVPSMLQALKQANFQLFMDHIKGFMDLYDVPGEKAVKNRFFVVLQSLENDIDKLNKVVMQSKSLSPVMNLNKFLLGLVQPRNGGLPTKLSIFISPYDFLNDESLSSHPMTTESVILHDLGMYATVSLEPHANNHQLQVVSLVNYVRTSDNRIQPQFVSINNSNSVLMSAAFVLKFKKPIALSEAVIRQIERLQGACSFSSTLTMMPMLEAVVKATGLTFPPGTQQFTVDLPGQTQKYFLSDFVVNNEKIQGALVKKIPFSYPAFIHQVIPLLRQQLMISTMLFSCIRHQTVPSSLHPVSVDVKFVTTNLLMVSFKHPQHDRMISVDVDISDINAPRCSVTSSIAEICTNSYASKVLQRCYSIPVTVRAILRHAGQQEENAPPPPAKMIKTDHAETMQKLVDIYTSRGHYVPYGSVNSATCYTKNIQSNQYSLCLRKFSGYKRPSTAILKPSNLPAKVCLQSLLNIQPSQLPTPEKSKYINTPMLASLLDGRENAANQSLIPHQPQIQLQAATQSHESFQQQNPTLLDLLEGSGSLVGEKRPRKPRKRRTTSETNYNPPSTGAIPVPSNQRKRKQSEEDISTKIKIESFDQSSQGSYASDIMSPTQRSLLTPTTPTAIHTKPAFPKPVTPSLSNESQLAKLLHGFDEEQKPKGQVKTIVMTTADIIDLQNAKLKSETNLVDVKLHLEKQLKKRVPDDKTKLIKHSSSIDSFIKEKKLKRSESFEGKVLKESKSFDSMPLSPSKKNITKLTIKQKSSKTQPVVKGQTPPLVIRSTDDRGSPKDKGKSIEKEKKKMKTQVSSEPNQRSVQDLSKMGFYGASNLKSLPKIPKRKPGDSQSSPTSPNPPPIPQKSPGQQKSPVSADWQRISPVPNRTNPIKHEDQQTTAAVINRAKSTTAVLQMTSSFSDSQMKRPALLPTPSTPPIEFSAKNATLQKRTSLDDVISRLTVQPSLSNASFSTPNHVLPSPHQKNNPESPKEINSPDDKSFPNTEPVCIPVLNEIENPLSPVPEIVTIEPKSIPLDSHKHSLSLSFSSKSFPVTDIVSSKASAIVKQSPVSRPLTFSPKPSKMNDGVDDDLMDVAIVGN